VRKGQNKLKRMMTRRKRRIDGNSQQRSLSKSIKLAKKEKDQDDTEDLKQTKFRGSVQRHRLSD